MHNLSGCTFYLGPDRLSYVASKVDVLQAFIYLEKYLYATIYILKHQDGGQQ